MAPTETSPRSFSLLHVILSLALMTTIASIAIPLWFGRGEVTLDSAVRLIARDVRYAQDLAVMAGAEVQFRLDPDGDGYRVVDASGNDLEGPVGNGPFFRSYSKDGVFRGVRMTNIQAGDDTTIHINAAGLVVDEVTLDLEFGSEERKVVVSEGEGDVQVRLQ